MAKVSFTAERVSSFEAAPGKTQTIYWDAKAAGLGLRVTPGGARSYIFESRLFGKTIRVTIGTAQAWPLAKARTEAARLKTVIDGGHDPREQAAEQQAAHSARKAEVVRQSVTFADAWDAYLADLQKKVSPKTKKPRSPQYIEDHRKLAAAGGTEKKRGKGLTSQGPLHSLMPLKLSAMTGTKIAAWLEDEVAERPTSAAYAYRMLKAWARWCEGQEQFSGLIPADCYSSQKVTALLPSAGTKDGDSLQREQLAVWFSAVRGLSNPVLSAYLQGLLINGPRREEMAELKWKDVDFDWNSITLRDKVEGSRRIPLTPYFRSLLLGLKTANETPPGVIELKVMAAKGKTWEPSPWVFPSATSKSGHIAEPRYAHQAAIEAAGLPHITLHGLRRSFGTLAEWCDAPVGIVAQIQGHKPSALAEKHYRRRTIDLLRKWHDQIEAWMLEQAGIDFKAPVTNETTELPPLE
ncbi:integrase family protein [Burkholderia sp. LAS2]|uniref:tyrosine-type recombinase/integrase n=1 Tax=Burkholderia sp. LAS2 TaxID=2813843 RepID=UPI001BCDE9DD|nr:integrase family protein [Burkholderia sp. LAS2]QVN12403.1 integrase family protein [Burkholderia sp. LAS2]